MPVNRPNIIKIYRILHINNVEFLLKNGMFTRHHKNADPHYINIGDSTLITQRNDYPIPINPPGGNLGDYIPFYFGPLSPMLLNIKTGYRGITLRQQSDIVYICCKLQDILQHCEKWCFTDGHAKTAITEFYNDIDHLDQIDWNIVEEKYWRNTEDDFDRVRRKQAEFLVKHHVPIKCISNIVVYNEDKRILVQGIIDRLGLKIPVLINSNNRYYY